MFRLRIAVLAVFVSGLALDAERQAAPEGSPSCMILDLDNDGIPLVTKDAGVSFDLDADGKPENVGWTKAGANDAFLAIDLNKNGRIDGGRELVGNRLPIGNGPPMSTGLRALTALQEGVVFGPDGKPTKYPPGIGIVDKDDAVFATLLLWVDVNHDGRSAAAELKTLSQRGISGIRTGMHGPDSAEAGNDIFMRGEAFLTKRGVEFPRTLIEVRLAR